MTHHHYSALKVLDGFQESVNGLHIEMVGWLVQVDEMRLFVSDDGKSDAALLPSGESPDFPQRHVTVDAEASKDVSSFLIVHARIVGLYAVHTTGLEIQRVYVMLSESAHSRIPVDVNLSCRGNKLLHHHLQQGALAGTVGPKDAYAALHVEVSGGLLEEGRLARVSEGNAVKLNQLCLRQSRWSWELDCHRARIVEGDGRILDLLHLV
mmetsp:Transcript_43335/g.77868  ORF Transcript_43335/g.77868 Transcript_43335/m.77868 type:complete len:209 (-) Transcript_43335:371-997(-)